MTVVDFEERVAGVHALARADADPRDNARDVRADGHVFGIGLDKADGGDALGKWRLRRRRGRLGRFALRQVLHERGGCKHERADGDDWQDDVFHGFLRMGSLSWSWLR
jgi:hypothetical protein